MRRCPISFFSEELGSFGELTEEIASEITKEDIDKVANNGDTTKRLVAKLIVYNDRAHNKLNKKIENQGITLSWISKFVWILISIFVTGVLGGFIALCFWGVRQLLGG